MKKLIYYSLHHPVSVLMYYLLAALLGAAAPFFLKVDYLPQTKERFILVQANYHGARAKDIRRLIAIPLEENLSSLKGIKNYESVSRDGKAFVKIELNWSADPDIALLETKALLDSSMEFLPEDCPKPEAKLGLDSNESAIKILAISTKGDLSEATDFVENELKRKILSFEETSLAKVLGGQKKQIKAIVDSKAAAFRSLSLQDIASSLSLSNFDYPAGTIRNGENDIILKTEGTFKNFSEILNAPIMTKNGFFKLKDFARVEKSPADMDSFCYYNGEPCVALCVFCKNNQNPLSLSKKIKSLAKESQNKNIKLILESDNSNKIFQSIKSLAISAALGIAIAFILLFIFFKSAKIALSIASIIPSGILASCLCLWAFKRSVNLISISGVTICIGMIVDNGIVAIESALSAKKREAFLQSLETAFCKTVLPNSASTITSAIVFVPLFFMGGIIGELFLDLAITVVCACLFSLVHSFTLLPAVCVLFLKDELKKARVMDISFLKRPLFRILKKSDRIKFLCPALTAFFAISALLILFCLKKELQPKGKSDFWTEKISFESGCGAKKMANETKALCARIKQADCVQSVFAMGGLEKNDWESASKADARSEDVFIKIKSQNIKKCKKEVGQILDSLSLRHSSQEREDLISERLSLADNFLISSDFEEGLFNDCKEFFGFGNFSPCEITEQKTFEADKAFMEKIGVTAQSLASALKSSFDGAAAGSYYENGREMPITVQFEKNEFASEKNLAELKILLGKSPVQLSAFGKWKEKKDESILYRRNGKDAKAVSRATALKAWDKAGKKLVSLKEQSLKELFSNGAFLLCVSLALLYCVLGAQTESFFKPFVYLIAIPPSFFGAALFLLLFNSSLNINSVIAFTLLFGASVNNSIILTESGGKNISSVFITSSTSIASLLPFAVDPFKANPQSSLPLAAAGGLLFSTAAVLIMVPNILRWRKNDF